MHIKFKQLFNSNIVRNFIVVFLGEGFSSILILINLSIMIRVLGLNSSSIVNLAISYVLVFDTIFNFQSFNSIIKFLPQYIITNDINRIKSYLCQGFLLDIFTAVISFCVSNLLLGVISDIFKWDSSILSLIRVYSFSILFNITGTSIGIIRIYNKFKYASYINVFINVLKSIFYIMSLFLKQNMMYFICIELIFSIINMILLFVVVKVILYKKNIKNIFGIKLNWDKDFLKFNFYCNFMTTLDVPISHLTPFLINNFIGIEFISVYKIIEKIGGIVAKVASPLVNIIYPDISMKVSEGNVGKAVDLVKKLFLILFSCGIFLLILITFSYNLWIDILIPDGRKFILNILFYLVFMIFKFSFIGVYPLFISLGYIKYNIYIVFIANLIYLLLIPLFCKNFNINGIIISQFIQVSLVVFTQLMIVKLGLRVEE